MSAQSSGEITAIARWNKPDGPPERYPLHSHHTLLQARWRGTAAMWHIARQSSDPKRALRVSQVGDSEGRAGQVFLRESIGQPRRSNLRRYQRPESGQAPGKFRELPLLTPSNKTVSPCQHIGRHGTVANARWIIKCARYGVEDPRRASAHFSRARIFFRSHADQARNSEAQRRSA